MEKYKGFILQSDSSTTEDKYYNGHRNEGAGTYSTDYFVRIIEPETLKSLIVTTMEEAKRAIDSWFTIEGKQMSNEILEAYDNRRKALFELEEKVEEQIKELKNEVHIANRELNELYQGLPPKFR